MDEPIAPPVELRPAVLEGRYAPIGPPGALTPALLMDEPALEPMREEGRGIAESAAPPPEAAADPPPGRGIPDRIGMPEPAEETRRPSMIES